MFQYALWRYLSLKNWVWLQLDIWWFKQKIFVGILRKDIEPKRTYQLDQFGIIPKIPQQSEIPFFEKLYRNISQKKIFGYFSLENRYIRFIYRSFKKIISLLFNIIFRHYLVEKHYHFDPKILSIKEKNIYIDWYWQSEKYFVEIEDIIRKDFLLLKSFPEKIIDTMAKNIELNNSVCVNVRRTDFLTNNIIGFCDINYYKKSLKIISEKVNNPVYFVFSDDLEWCKKNLKQLPYDFIFVGHEFAWENFQYYFALMRRCKWFIIPNSSFWWWAAWLAEYKNKVVIAPKKRINDPWLNTNDVLPKSRICI